MFDMLKSKKGSVMPTGNQLSRNPLSFVAILLGAWILIKVVVVVFPLLISAITEMSGIGNFTFSALFADDALGEIIVSAVVLIAILAVLGFKMSGGSKR